MRTLKETILILPKNQLRSVVNCLKRITEDKESIYNVLMYKRKEDFHGLFESTINRLLWHIQNDSGLKSLAILSAWRDELPADHSQKQHNNSDEQIKVSTNENNLRNYQLRQIVQSLDYRYVTSYGQWCWCKNESIPYKDCPEDQRMCKGEQSIIIFNISKEEAQDLAWRYEQEAYIFWDREKTNNKFIVHTMKTGVEETFDDISVALGMTKDSQFFTLLRKRPFVLGNKATTIFENAIIFTNGEDRRNSCLYESWSHITEDIAYEIIKLSDEEKKDIIDSINKELMEE